MSKEVPNLTIDQNETLKLGPFYIPDTEDTEAWKADWLLSPFSALVWELKTNKSRFSKVKKCWSNTKKIYFTDNLPNGDTLTDESYIKVVQTIKKMVYGIRQGVVLPPEVEGEEATRSQTQHTAATGLKTILKWMIWRRDYKPAIHGFRQLVKSDVDTYIEDCLYGAQFVDGTFETIKQFIIKADNDGQLANFMKEGRLNYVKLAKELKLNTETQFIPSQRLQYRLHDLGFETAPLPEWTRDGQNEKRNELPSAHAERYKEVGASPISISNLQSLVISFKYIGQFAAVMDELKGLDWAPYNAARVGKAKGFMPKGRTKTIPIQTALEYLDHAIFWIKEIGPELVKLKLDCDKQLLHATQAWKKDHFSKQVKLNISVKPSKELASRGLSITRYNQHKNNVPHAQMRQQMSVEEAVDVLVAAVYILTGILGCKRVDELLSLTRNCCRPSEDGGSDLWFGLRKASLEQEFQIIPRPVPEVVAEGIDLVLNLRPSALDCHDEGMEKDPLFLSSYKVLNPDKPKKSVQMSEDRLRKILYLFADINQITPDEQGRRWYIKTHQLRRIFAISYFWHDKFASLPALTWFMGHSDPEMTLRYITEAIRGEELPEEEARYIVATLRGEGDEIEGLEELLDQVKKELRITAIQPHNSHLIEDVLTKKMKGDGVRIKRMGTKSRLIMALEEEAT